MQQSDLTTLCQRQSGNTTGDALAGFIVYLNLAQKEVAGALDNWLELHASTTISAVQGTESYSYATDLSDFRKVFITTSGYDSVITEINYQTFRDNYGATGNDGQGTPKYFYFAPGTANTISLFPIPDRSYTIQYDYIKVPTDMVATTDSPFFPARWHHILADFALAMFYESPIQRDHNVANKYWAKWQNDLTQMKKDVQVRNLNIMPISYGSGVNEGYGPGINPV